jgi:hypothetical protein
MDCQNCNKRDIYTTQVPLVVLENTRAQMDAHAARLVRVIVLLIILLVGSNGLWLWRESQFADEVYEITQENEDGYNNFIGNDGDIYNGEAEDQGYKADP